MTPLRSRSLSLGAVRAFEAAARLGSLKAAAGEIGVTPGAISHQVKALETQLGAALFERRHRELCLTSTGEALASATSAAFGTIDRALDELATAGLIARATTLTLSAAPSFAVKWLVPRLHDFQAAHPHIELRLDSDGALSDPAVDRRLDVAIRYGTGPYESLLHAERLWPSGRIVPVCAPELAAKLLSPAALTSAILLRTALPAGASEAEPIGWLAWFAAAGAVGRELRAQVDRAPLFGTTQLAIEAALAASGVALAPYILVADDLRGGRLASPSPVSLPDPHAYWLLFRRDRAQEAPLRQFANWIRQEASTCARC